MYEAFFEMKETPFVSNIPTESLDLSSMLDETLSRLEYAASRQLFAVVTADVGCGKSTATRKLADTLPPDDYELLYLSDSKLTPR